MNKFAFLLAAGLVSFSAGAYAAEEGLESSPANQTALQTSQTMSNELQDGTKVEVAPDNTVSVFKQDGVKSAPADGPLTLKDGTTITVKDGKKV